MRYAGEIAICLLFALLISSWVWGAGVVVPNTVTTAGDYPVADSNQVKGGPVFVEYTADLRTVSETLKRKGMIAHVRENDTYYRAYSTHGHYWERYAPAAGGGVTVHNNLTGRDAADAHPVGAITGLQPSLDEKLPAAIFNGLTTAFRGIGPQGPPGANGANGPRGYDGLPGKTLRCEVFGGTRGVTYSAVGDDPQPGIIDPFYAYLYDSDTLVASEYLTFTWYIPVDDTLLLPPPIEVDGMQYHRQWFQPQLFGIYSAAKTNNTVRVEITYTQPDYPFRSWICAASAPVVATRTGASGEGSATISEPAVIEAFAAGSSPAALVLDNNSTASKPKLQLSQSGVVRGQWGVGSGGSEIVLSNSTGNSTLLSVKTDGNTATMSLQARLGYETVKIVNDGTMELRSTNGLLWMILNGTARTLTMYGDDGSTPVFVLYPNGTWKGQEGWPSSTGQYITKSPTGVGSWSTPASSGSETQTTILDKINDPVTGMVLERVAGSGESADAPLFRIKDGSGKTRIIITSGNGLKMYRGNGTTPALTIYSSGRLVVGGA